METLKYGRQNFYFQMVALFLIFCGSPMRAQDSPPASPGPERLSLDRGWLFHEGEVSFPVISGHQMSYSNAKAGTSWGAAAPGFDDSSWR